jgi:hypothetical protein
VAGGDPAGGSSKSTSAARPRVATPTVVVLILRGSGSDRD